MNSAQIDSSLRRDPCTVDMWRGVFPLDKLKGLPSSKSLPAGYIANTAPSTHAGKHWVAFYFTEDGAEFFDSYGFAPARPQMTKLLKAYGDKKWKRNKLRLQGNFSTVCGQYCIFYLTLRARGWTMKEIEGEFGDDTERNDGLVRKFVNKHFNLNTEEINFDFIIQSVCPLVA